MSADDEEPVVVRLEQAVSDRSTCRATHEKIGRGEWRVGLEVWLAGRMSWTWQKPLPFLQHCYVEYCLHPGNCGTCKKSGNKFRQGEARFVCTSGADKKVFLSLAAAGEELRPVLQHVGARAFRPLQFKGVAELAQKEREEFYAAFQVPKAEAARFSRAHPAPPAPGGDSGEARPAKRARPTPSAGAGGQPGGLGAQAPGSSSAGMRGEGGQGDGESDEGEVEEHGEGQEGLTEYERQRQEQIQRNRERMMALQLPALAAELAEVEHRARPRPAAKPKGLSTRRQRLSEGEPRRASLRVQGKAPDGSQVHSERRGEIIVVSGEAIRYNPALAKPEEAPQERHQRGNLEFKSSNGDAATDAAFLELLARAAAAPVQAAGQGARPGAARVGKLKLSEADVAKVTKAGITHVAFHPSAEMLLLACGDKHGHLGLWDVNNVAVAAAPKAPAGAAAAGGADADEEAVANGEAAVSLDHKGASPSSEFEGVLQFKHHSEYISGLKWAGGGGSGGTASKLFTGSYDGSLRALDLAAGGVSQLAFGDEELEFSALDVTADGRTAILGDNEGGAHFVDVRAGKRAHPSASIHNRKVNTIHFEPAAEQVFVTASTDSSIHLWDVRTLGSKMKPLATAQHSQTCQAAFFAPDGSRRVASTSFDDTVRVWDAADGLKPLVRARHDNQTGRWVFPFRAVWGPGADCIIVGNMKRYVDVLGAATGELQSQLSGEGMTAIAARNCVHPTLPVLAATTASGRAHVYR